MVSFIIHNVKPCSINKGYYKTRKVLTVDGRRYRKRLLCTINDNQLIIDQINKLTSKFDPEKHALKVQYYFYMPKKVIYLKGKGAMSRLGGDVDNLIKLTTDFLFNPKYMGHVFPNVDKPTQIVNFNIDDQFIADIRAYKLPSVHEYHSIGVKAHIVNKKPKKHPSFDLKEIFKK